MNARKITPIVLYGMCNGVGQMVSDVIRMAKKTRSIDLLQIHGHGTGGLQNISAGEFNGGELLAGISNDNFEKIKSTLNQLTPYFSTNGRIQLMGCNVAGNKAGDKLLIKLAKLWGHTVTAGALSQYSNTAEEVFEFEGPTSTAHPNGDLSGCSANYSCRKQRAKALH